MKQFKNKKSNKSTLYFAARKQQKTAYRKSFNHDYGWGWNDLTQAEWVELKLHPEALTEDEALTTSWASVKGCLQGWRGAISVKGRNGLKTIIEKPWRPTIAEKKVAIEHALRPNVWAEVEADSIEVIEEVA